jgi:hypothetical protein
MNALKRMIHRNWIKKIKITRIIKKLQNPIIIKKFLKKEDYIYPLINLDYA